MPKKTTASRSGTQRNRPRAQKNIEVVRQPSPEQQEAVTEEPTEPVSEESIVATPAPSPTSTSRSATRTATKARTATPETRREEQPAEQESSPSTVAPKGSASARLAARRQGQRTQTRGAAALITAEHYTYVRHDLTIIAILAAIMVVAIIVLYFVLARGF